MSKLTVREIIAMCDGAKGLHEASKKAVAKGRQRKVVAEKTVYDWCDAGIPERHWALVKSICDVSPEQLHWANEYLRANGKRRVPESQAAA
jgi:hypothetical protein